MSHSESTTNYLLPAIETLMNPLITKARRELASWQQDSPKASNYPHGLYRFLDDYLVRLSQAKNDAEFKDIYHTMMHQIIDSGPVGNEFLPSLSQIGGAVEKFEKTRRKRDSRTGSGQ